MTLKKEKYDLITSFIDSINGIHCRDVCLFPFVSLLSCYCFFPLLFACMSGVCWKLGYYPKNKWCMLEQGGCSSTFRACMYMMIVCYPHLLVYLVFSVDVLAAKVAVCNGDFKISTFHQSSVLVDLSPKKNLPTVIKSL